MMYITIRTDKPQAELSVYQDVHRIAHEQWLAHRQLAESIHTKLHDLLASVGADWPAIQGIVAFRGPGSFTGLRIGLSVANALAYGLQIPIVAAGGDDWATTGLQRLQQGEADILALPEYGAPVHITQPRK